MEHLATITISLATPSLNVLNTKHWSFKRKLKAEWFSLMNAALHTLKAVPKAKEGERRRVTFTRYSLRLLDVDNFSGGAKLVLDSLRRPRTDGKKSWAGLQMIWDDDEAHVEAVYSQAKAATKKDVRTVITIERFP